MRVIEKKIIVAATPETIFRIYEDVGNWSRWDPDTRSSRLSDGLNPGSKGSLTPAKGNTIPIEVTSVAQDRHFTLTSKTFLFHLKFDHELIPVASGTEVVHRVKFGGLLKPFLTRVLGPQVEKGLPVTLARLKVQAEASEASNR